MVGFNGGDFLFEAGEDSPLLAGVVVVEREDAAVEFSVLEKDVGFFNRAGFPVDDVEVVFGNGAGGGAVDDHFWRWFGLLL